MVEIFKTDVGDKRQADAIVKRLNQSFPNLKINFDLDDCDRILRIEGTNLEPPRVAKKVERMGVQVILIN